MNRFSPIAFQLGFLLFLISFFIAPAQTWQNNYFYYIIIPLLIINIKSIVRIYQQQSTTCLSEYSSASSFSQYLKHVHLAFKHQKNPELYIFRTALFLFLLYAFFCTLSGVWNSPFYWGNIWLPFRNSFFVFSLCVSVYLYTFQARIFDLKKSLDTVLCIASVSAIISIITFYHTHHWPDRLEGFFIYKQAILADWIYGIPLLYAFFQGFQTKSKLSMAIYALLFIPLLIFILTTQSRGPFLALGVAVTFGLLLLKNKRAYWSLAILLSLFAVMTLLFRHHVTTVFFRWEIWKTVIQAGMQNFWLGHGFTAKKIVTVSMLDMKFGHAHNLFIEMFYLGGIIGLILLSAVCGIGLYAAWTKRFDPIARLFGICFIFGLTCLLTDGSEIIRGPSEVWLSFWIPWCLLIFPTITQSSAAAQAPSTTT